MNNTFEKVHSLSAVPLSINVAEFIGWWDIHFKTIARDPYPGEFHYSHGFVRRPYEDEVLVGYFPYNKDTPFNLLQYKKVPIYAVCLNDMHKAEEIIYEDEVLAEKYEDNLLDVIVKGCGYDAAFTKVHASSRQRAEAFVLTMSSEPQFSEEKMLALKMEQLKIKTLGKLSDTEKQSLGLA